MYKERLGGGTRYKIQYELTQNYENIIRTPVQSWFKLKIIFVIKIA